MRVFFQKTSFAYSYYKAPMYRFYLLFHTGMMQQFLLPVLVMPSSHIYTLIICNYNYPLFNRRAKYVDIRFWEF